jgi:hypothetical protein
MKNGLLMATMALVGMTITPAQASTYTFGWVTNSNLNTDLGLLYSLSNNGVTLTAYGLTAPSTLTSPATAGPGLYTKNGGTGETGLGMATDPGNDHEISAALNDGIQIDFSSALAAAPKATVTMVISSVQSGEGWALYGSNTLYTVAGNSKTDGALGEPLLSGAGGAYTNATTTITLPDWGEYTYYTLMATDTGGCGSSDANILLGTVTVNGGLTANYKNSPAPEPGSLLMAGTALIAIGVLMKKKQTKA